MLPGQLSEPVQRFASRSRLAARQKIQPTIARAMKQTIMATVAITAAAVWSEIPSSTR